MHATVFSPSSWRLCFKVENPATRPTTFWTTTHTHTNIRQRHGSPRFCSYLISEECSAAAAVGLARTAKGKRGSTWSTLRPNPQHIASFFQERAARACRQSLWGEVVGINAHSFRSTSSRNGGPAAPKYDVASAGGDLLAQTPADTRIARGIGRFVDAAGRGKEFVLSCLFSSLCSTFGASTKRACRRKRPRTPHGKDTYTALNTRLAAFWAQLLKENETLIRIVHPL